MESFQKDETRKNPGALTAPRQRWLLPVAFATAAGGIALLVAASGAADQPRVRWSALALVGAAVLEFAAGRSLSRRGGAGMSHQFAGAMAIGLASFLAGVVALFPGVLAPQPVAMVLAVFCLANGLFRVLDVVIDRPVARLAEAFDGAFTFVLGAIVLENWHHATPAFVAVVAGLELLVGGLTLAASRVALRRHPDQPPYRDLQERLSHATPRVESPR